MKVLFKYILISILPAYLIAALVLYGDEPDNGKCQKLEVQILDQDSAQFINTKEILAEINRSGINPSGKFMSRINTENIEKSIKKNQLIERAECYKTPQGSIRIEITQRIPIIRIIGLDGSYYIDRTGNYMPTTPNFTASLPLATGYIDRPFAQKELYRFACYLHNHDFWRAQIEQIYITSQKEIELIPRVGNQLILLGNMQNFETKLENLMCFYKQALPQVGWNKYDTISLKYNNQVICTRKN